MLSRLRIYPRSRRHLIRVNLICPGEGEPKMLQTIRQGIALITVLAFATHITRAQPASAPATAPAEPMTLDGGKLLFTPPPGFILQGTGNEGRSASFSMGDNRTLISVIATPQGHVIPDDFPPKLAKILADRIREEAARGEMDIVMQPRAERDPRMLLRMHDKFNTEERFGDRAQMYRGVGLYLVGVVVTVYTEDEAEAKHLHEIGADLLLSVKLNRGNQPVARGRAPARSATTRPVTFTNAKIRATPPTGWEADPTDTASGLIVNYRDPVEASSMILLSVRRLPPEARRDPKLRDIIIDELVQGETASFKIEGAQVSGDTQTIPDRRFLRKTRTDYSDQDRQIRVTSRQIRAGDVLVSVTMVALDDRADSADAIADKLALDVKPLR